ncbi:MAG: TetR/AcrR family transcriptional regulator [Ignavibacteria bacterium]|jgi:TetR/AcrR family transcriptional repressor of mexJK operon|nr:TetR/AcrR family transcriptional regulator [Ignavibacteria bacterium]MCU7501743.1 TetR/AcrR family transcriptional regulator [Ignavibacteria bacterium]MCU7516850.1 TetR/AcrR family transcriptional regulator [Ignavibacteria bacterium]
MSEQLAKEKEKEQQILKAARQIFARYGFSKTTMEDIAEDVEMGKASLYYYFPTKESLFKAAMMSEKDEFVRKVGKILDKQTSATAKLYSYVEERLKFFQELVNLGTLTVHSFLEKKSIFRNLFEELGEQELTIVKNIINEGKISGEFKSDMDERVPEVLLHVLHGLRLRMVRTIAGASTMDNKTYRELLSEMLLTIDIFISGLKP